MAENKNSARIELLEEKGDNLFSKFYVKYIEDQCDYPFFQEYWFYITEVSEQYLLFVGYKSDFIPKTEWCSGVTHSASRANELNYINAMTGAMKFMEDGDLDKWIDKTSHASEMFE